MLRGCQTQELADCVVFSVKFQSEVFGCCGEGRWVLMGSKEVHEVMEPVGM